MAKLVENYLDYLNGDRQHLNEGVLSVLNHIFLFIGFGSPADARFKAIIKSYTNCLGSCSKAYPDEVEVKTTQGKKGRTDEDVRKEREETIETVKKNPELGKCLIMCYYGELQEIISLLKKNRKTICNKNINKDLCEKWLNKHIPYIEAELKALKNAVDLMKRQSGGSGGRSSNTQVIVNTLKKIL